MPGTVTAVNITEARDEHLEPKEEHNNIQQIQEEMLHEVHARMGTEQPWSGRQNTTERDETDRSYTHTRKYVLISRK